LVLPPPAVNFRPAVERFDVRNRLRDAAKQVRGLLNARAGLVLLQVPGFQDFTSILRQVELIREQILRAGHYKHPGTPFSWMMLPFIIRLSRADVPAPGANAPVRYSSPPWAIEAHI
jgi:hypothetical protein